MSKASRRMMSTKMFRNALHPCSIRPSRMRKVRINVKKKTRRNTICVPIDAETKTISKGRDEAAQRWSVHPEMMQSATIPKNMMLAFKLYHCSVKPGLKEASGSALVAFDASRVVVSTEETFQVSPQ